MRTLIVIFITMVGAYTCHGQSPNSKEWFQQKKTQKSYLIQQIAALEVYYNYLKKGYQIADKGLTLIGGIRSEGFENDKSYIASLRKVSPAVQNSPHLKPVFTLRSSIIDHLSQLLSQCRASEFYTSEEVRLIEKVYSNMEHECEIAISELDLVISTDTEMKDDERINRLDKIYGEMQERNTFSTSFCEDVIGVGLERARLKHETTISSNLNDL